MRPPLQELPAAVQPRLDRTFRQTMEDVAKFLFLGAGSVALFTFLSVAHWVDVRAAERQARERFLLLRRLAELPGDSAQLVLEVLREEDARAQEKEWKCEQEGPRAGMYFAAVLLAVGLGLIIMLVAVSPETRVWTIGLLPILIGLVNLGFAVVRRPAASAPPER